MNEKINQSLKQLKFKEPLTTLTFRLAIIEYELDRVAHYCVYKERFPQIKQLRGNLKLELADAITMLHMLCLDLELDFDALQTLGLKHLRERYEDFVEDKWVPLK